MVWECAGGLGAAGPKQAERGKQVSDTVSGEHTQRACPTRGGTPPGPVPANTVDRDRSSPKAQLNWQEN